MVRTKVSAAYQRRREEALLAQIAAKQAELERVSKARDEAEQAAPYARRRHPGSAARREALALRRENSPVVCRAGVLRLIRASIPDTHRVAASALASTVDYADAYASRIAEAARVVRMHRASKGRPVGDADVHRVERSKLLASDIDTVCAIASLFGVGI